jgi:hypothetical protein
MKHIITVLAVILLASCKREIKVIFPDVIQNQVTQHVQNQNYVVIYVDSSDCTTCSLRNLAFWNAREKELKNNNTGILLVIHHSNEQLVLNTLETLEIFFPVIFDKGRKFKAKNIEIFYAAQDNTFVMDKDKNVIFIGSPIATEKNGNHYKYFKNKEIIDMLSESKNLDAILVLYELN